MAYAAEPTTSIEIPERLVPFIDQLVALGIFGISRTEVVTHLIQVQIAELYGAGFCGKARAELERARAAGL